MSKLISAIVLVISLCSIGSMPDNSDHAETYQCMPCGQPCDKDIYPGPGKCTSCHMDLVKKSAVRFKTIQPAQLCNYIAKNPGVILLDVRTKEEFEGKVEPELGRLKNAVNIPIQDLETRINELAKYKGKEIIVYCSRSHRSPRASYILNMNGYRRVINMEGGLSMLKDKKCLN